MKKKRSYITIVLIVALLASLHVYAENDNPQPKEKKQYSMIDGLSRGFANILAGWIEAPRGMVYYSVEWPIIGIIPGTLEGAGMAFIRTIGGAVDLFTIGYLSPGDTVYDTMDAPMLPWESPWLPSPENEDDYDILNTED